MPTQREIAEHLFMSDRNLREVLPKLGIDLQTWSMDDVREAYILDLREKAAGRGGSQAEALNRARIEESTVKAANGRLAYHEKLGTLVPADEASRALKEWAAVANRELQAALTRLAEMVGAAHSLNVDPSMVDQIAGATAGRIAGHADKLGRRLCGRSDSVQPTALDSDSGVDVD
ncbi:hypothetical protein UB43_03510 [Pseudomonas sp. 21]|nr:hypothetical protein UB43_03510 [Pseudomonas sp. 21]